jgi:hypothetical protein
LHHILKLAIHTRHCLNHFHFQAIFCMKLPLMNIVSLCLSPTNILLVVINGSYSCSLSTWLVIDCCWKLVASCSWKPVKHSYHYDIDFVFLHVISRCLVSYPNIIVCIDQFHLSLIHYWI